MNVQNSFKEYPYGTLYIVTTPIGNLGDMTARAIEVLQQVEVIAAEDTRQTMKLVNHFQLTKKLVSYHDHNRFDGAKQILAFLEEGKDVALVSDAGTPCVSDPGDELVRIALENNFQVVPIPGVSAALAALVASGLSAKQFYFYGFLERKEKAQLAELQELAHLQSTLIFYESPYRVKETISRMHQVFGGRKACVARELTKKFEQFLRGDLEELLQYLEEHPLKGECVIVVEGNNGTNEVAADWEDITVKEHVEQMIEKGYSVKDAMKEVSKLRTIGKREVYAAFHID
ncbi:MAG: 16S rRNA (cytidine(1402)-2'-O)-methyltransferase [Bacilli bacterium]